MGIMKITPNATSDEKSSPFYKVNEEFCAKFERYIASKNGKVKGNYNAYSYLIFGKIDTPKNWSLMYKKASFSSSGNLLLSSKHQSLLVLSEWETEKKGTHNSEFLIRRKTTSDFLKKMINKSLSELELYDQYILEVKNQKPQLIYRLTKILKNLLLSGEIYKIELRNEILKIEMRTEEHHFEIFDKLITEI